jgi:hypothetical protein
LLKREEKILLHPQSGNQTECYLPGLLHNAKDKIKPLPMGTTFFMETTF